MIVTTFRSALRIFLTGLLAALPLAATMALVVWAVQVLYAWLGPGSLLGKLLIAIGLGVTGSEVAGYLIGMGIVMVAIFALGLVVHTRLQKVVADGIGRMVQRIPVVGHVYDLVKRFVDLLGDRDRAGAHSMSPVWLRFGGQGQAAVLGLLSSPEAVLVGGEPYLAVLVPTAPVPVGGALIYVPQAWVSQAEVSIEGLTSIYVSMGVTSPQHLTGSAGNPNAR